MTNRLIELRATARGTIVLAAALYAATASAQTSTSSEARNDAAPTADSPMSGDIVVTALKRETRLQDTPLSISALSGQSLLNRGSSSINDIARFVPGLNITETNTGQSRLTIRGVQSAGESTVGLYLGETPVTGPNSATSDPSSITPDLNMFDVQRVEVLRGPQGTLYGSGSMSGTVKFIFNEPDSHHYSGAFDGSVASVDHGGTSYSSRGMVNIPLIDGIAGLRIVGYDEHRAGYVDDVVYHEKNINWSKSYGTRAILKITPTNRLTIQGMISLQHQYGSDTPYWYPSVGTYKTDNATRIPFPDTFHLYNVKADYDLGFAKATVSSSRYTFDATKYIDGTRTALYAAQQSSYCSAYFGITGSCNGVQKTGYSNYVTGQLPLAGYQPMRVGSWAHEARLSSAGNGWLDWTVGIFREVRKDSATSTTVAADPATGEIDYPLNYKFARTLAIDLKQTAVFGEVTIKPFQGLSITGGGRRYDYDKKSTAQVLMTSYINGSTAGPPTTKSDDASGWVTKANISYTPARGLLFYAERSEGFRPGGVNTTPGLPASLVPYSSDSLVDYEAGAKTSWLQGRLTFNVAAYQIDWSNMQISATIPSYTFITNVGKSRIRGVEAEMAAQPFRGLSISANLAYQDGRLRADQRSGTITAPGLKGDKIPYEPNLNGAFTAEYSWPLFSTFDGLIHGDYTYTGKSHSQFRPTNPYYEPMGNFSQVNFRLGVDNKDWGLYLYLNNAFNVVGRLYVTSGVFSEQQTLSNAPRTVGLELRRNF